MNSGPVRFEGFGWSEARIDHAKKRWLEGASASMIAREIGGDISRNAVIGKLHRLGLTGARKDVRKSASAPPLRMSRPAPSSIAEPTSTPLRATSVVKVEPVAAPLIAKSEPERGGGASVISLGRRMCSWPLGDPGSPSFRFCGRATAQGSFCPDHARRAYQPRATTGRSPAAELERSLRRYL